MDPLCHTLVGGTLAATPLGDRSWGAKATLLLACNFPDVDAAAYFWGHDVALYFRRGWTHGVLALALLPAILTALVVAWGHWRGADGLRPRRVAALAYLGVLTHPCLDWLNTYGMRWGMPFDGRWTYGDAVLIVDPWLWLMLGGAVFLRFSAGRLSLLAWAVLAVAASLPVLRVEAIPVWGKALWSVGIGVLAVTRAIRGRLPRRAAQRLAGLALALAAVYVGSLWILGRGAARAVTRQLADVGLPAGTEVFTGPLPADPGRWDVLLITTDSLHPGVYRYGALGDDALSLAPGPLARDREDPRVAAALDAHCVRGLRSWMRFPFFILEEGSEGTLVHILDARYVRRVGARRFASATVRLGPADEVIGCR